MITRYEIYCGCDSPTYSPDEAEQVARSLAAKTFPDGHSVRVEEGCWRSRETGEIISERTVVITWLSSGADNLPGKAHAKVAHLAGNYKRLAAQESVLVAHQEIHSVFV